ncbi:MAG: hypothetical protein IH624_17885 [Phycisphaerae bacterium]|nr:hypothetical protein [Phycisphaerae bacterium]
MTKMQIIAKAVLSALGLHLALTFAANIENLIGMSYHNTSPWPNTVSLAWYTAVIAAIVIFAVFYNNRPAQWLAGDGPALSRPQQHRTLVAAYRLTLLFLGLFLLAGSVDTILAILPMLWPPTIRQIIQWLIGTDVAPPLFDRPASRWLGVIVQGVKAALACYLITGAPHFIRWQLKHPIAQLNPTPAPPEEPK